MCVRAGWTAVWLLPLLGCALAARGFEQILQSQYVGDVFRYAGPASLLPAGRGLLELDPDCARDLKLLERAAERREPWALKMLDASSKIPSGIVEGNIVDFGIFDQCIEVRREANGSPVDGKHCMYEINLTQDDRNPFIRPTMSICLPATCSAADVLELANATINANDELTSLGISLASARCTSTSTTILDREFTIWLCVMGVFVGFLGLCTFCDLMERRATPERVRKYNRIIGHSKNRKLVDKAESKIEKNIFDKEKYVVEGPEKPSFDSDDGKSSSGEWANGSCRVIEEESIPKRDVDRATGETVLEERSNGLARTLARFSVLRSAKAILSLKTSDDNLPVVNGLRFLSTAWVVLFHAYCMQLFSCNVNFLAVTQWFSSWAVLFPILSQFSVDTFLTLSGFLMTYTFFKKIQKQKLNIPVYYLHRYVRLTPPAAVVAYSAVAMFTKLGSGPRWELLMDIFVTGLRSKWQYSLLYVQNLVDQNDYRVLHFWSLCVDMQLFLISPFILYPLYKKPRIGLTIIAVLVVACQLITASIFGINRYPLIYIGREMNATFAIEAFNATYQVPYTRASPWLFGILVGFIIRRNIKPKKIAVQFGWFLAVVLFVSCILGLRCATAHPDFNMFREVLFMILARPAWSFIICWILYTSVFNCGGILQRILSWKYFLPLSRISYSIYLVHLGFSMFRNASSRVPSYFSNISIYQSYISDLVLCIVFAFFFSVCFEVPVLILDGMIFKGRQGSLRK